MIITSSACPDADIDTNMALIASDIMPAFRS